MTLGGRMKDRAVGHESSWNSAVGPDELVGEIEEENVLAVVERGDELVHFRDAMTTAGFNIRPGIHPIVPVMLGDARLAQDMARLLLDEGVYVIGFSFPVVPKGAARIRVQLSAAHSRAQVDQAIAAFIRVGKRLGVIPG